MTWLKDEVGAETPCECRVCRKRRAAVSSDLYEKPTLTEIPCDSRIPRGHARVRVSPGAPSAGIIDAVLSPHGNPPAEVRGPTAGGVFPALEPPEGGVPERPKGGCLAGCMYIGGGYFHVCLKHVRVTLTSEELQELLICICAEIEAVG